MAGARGRLAVESGPARAAAVLRRAALCACAALAAAPAFAAGADLAAMAVDSVPERTSPDDTQAGFAGFEAPAGGIGAGATTVAQNGGGIEIIGEDEAGGGIEIVGEDEAGGGIEIVDEPRQQDDGGGLLIIEEAPEEEAESEIFIIEDDEAAEPLALEPEAPEGEFRFRIDDLRAELGHLPDSKALADFSGYLGGSLRIDWDPAWSDTLEFRAGARADYYTQWNGREENEVELDFKDTYARYRDGATRITLGAQTVLWGRVDEFPPTDRLSVQDLSRYILDELPDRRRATPAVRVEHSVGEFRADALVVPFFRSAELPDQDSIWFPVDQTRGRIVGVETAAVPLFAAAIRQGTVGDFDDFENFGGAGLRVSRSGARLDYAVSVQRVRHSLPYYQLDPGVRADVLSGTPLATAIARGRGPTLREVHPLTWVVGGDFGFAALGGTWRFEAAWVSDHPVTTTDVLLDTESAVDFVAGAEFFPGGGDTRLTMQLAGHVLTRDRDILDQTSIFNLNGEVEHPFSFNRWIWKVRWAAGLDERDFYVNPEIRFVGFEPHEFYGAAHFFSGTERNANGFFRDNDLFVIGWRARF